MQNNGKKEKPGGFGTPEDLNRVAQRYAVRITPAAYDAMVSNAPDDPVALQYIPDARELDPGPGEDPDPTGDAAHSPVPGIVHRYPDRVLLMPVHSCAVYCRYCFRREKVGQSKDVLSAAEIDAALDYIRARPEIYEVILSGGDPLILSPRRLQHLLQQIEAIPHVQVLRIHSRVPVADPDRVTDELCAALETQKALYLAVHVNHAQELSATAESALRRLHKSGCVLISQSVLLRGVNDSAETLETLFRRLTALRVKPYYLHHMDKAPGTSHFRLPLAQGQIIFAALRGRLSGLCLPSYMLDIPGGHGKIPVSSPCLRELSEGLYEATDYKGHKHRYES